MFAIAADFFTLDLHDTIATVTLSRPERRNALHPAAHYELDEAFRALEQDASLRAIIVTGAGDRAFCAGYDLHSSDTSGRIDLPAGGFAGLTLRTDYPLPLIAAVNGLALGGGFELALACDIIIAADTATFGLPEPKVGWAALGGGLQRLPRAIGTKRAMGMVLTGRSVSAAEGMELGFVNEVVAPGALAGRARQVAGEIAACAPLAVRCSKQVVYASLDMPDLTQALDITNYPLAASVLASNDGAEGRRAFAERRPPRWSGT